MQIKMIGAMWCPSCLIMRSRIRKLIKIHPEIALVEYDFDMDREKIPEFSDAKILPIIIFEKDGRETFRFVGEKSVSELGKFMEENPK
ncbi:MAG TPA: thioredoxin family protein [Bacillota bacterium]|nr:thioredoxin family protein [Bacillota bacterium]HPF42133.1 thioredoxin family protein [Bacillota bacterium]HPJ85340.1 thioredoxin family protein [Bacillota bacterium]HPQ61364.1 thioredoxin family protein [Bacillota bacterium]